MRASFALAFTAINVSSFATNLTGKLNADDRFQAYLSTNDSTLGVLIGDDTSNSDLFRWRTTDTITGTLAAGQDYYLHIKVSDKFRVIAGLLGSFTLDSTNHKFVNGTQKLLTNVNDWKVSQTGFGLNYETPISYGKNGVQPWDYRSGNDANAQWIWTSSAGLQSSRYFSTKISAVHPVPEPASIAALGAGVLGLLRRRRQKA